MTHLSGSEIARRLEDVAVRIEAAAERAGRSRSEVTLIAVSKGAPSESIREALGAGQREFGENRADEGAAKAAELQDVRWHFIGRLQRNKVRGVLGFADVIHSVDRLELAREISRRAVREVDVLLEVNVSGERSKAGVTPDLAAELAETVRELPRLNLIGLMTMAPLSEDPGLSRPYFQRLAAIRDELRSSLADERIRHLSMGMSQDYEVAVEEGATMVRVGQAVFGPRRQER